MLSGDTARLKCVAPPPGYVPEPDEKSGGCGMELVWDKNEWILLEQKILDVREQFSKLEMMVVTLPTDTSDRRTGVRVMRKAIGDVMSELTWWRTP